MIKASTEILIGALVVAGLLFIIGLLYSGSGRDVLEAAIELAQKKNIDFVDHCIKKCVVYLDPGEFHSTWLGNKAVYRTRMAVADGGGGGAWQTRLRPEFFARYRLWSARMISLSTSSPATNSATPALIVIRMPSS